MLRVNSLLARLGADDDAYRTPYYLAIAEHLSKYPRRKPQRIAEFGSAANGVIAGLLAEFGHDDYSLLRYPDYDLHDLSNVERQSYDVAILEQILEHLSNPFQAAEQLRQILRPGGLVIAATVFLYPMHYIEPSDKQDYFRFTPLGLRSVFRAYDVNLAQAYGSLRFVQHLSEHGWFEQGRSGGYTANTIRFARALDRFDMTDEDFGVTTLVLATNPYPGASRTH
jgi:hypothetical protein